MGILVVEDNFLASELIRLAIEDAHFNVVGPVASLEAGMRMAGDVELDGALLDIDVGGPQVFPLARMLQSRGVPFIFVTGYDRSILPEDMESAPLVEKPIFMEDLARITAESFPKTAPPRRVAAGLNKQASRIAQLRARIQSGEQRRNIQKRRLQRLQVTGTDPTVYQLAADLLEQMNISLDIMSNMLVSLLLGAHKYRAADTIRHMISDGMIDPDDTGSIEYWAVHFGLESAELLVLAKANAWSARLVEKAIAMKRVTGPVRKSDALD